MGSCSMLLKRSISSLRRRLCVVVGLVVIYLLCKKSDDCECISDAPEI